MSTVGEVHVPVDEFALERTLTRVPDAEFDVEWLYQLEWVDGLHVLGPALAYERGYFESPRAVNASELAADLGISQQVFSERLRRASRNLLGETIASDDPPGALGSPDRWHARDP